MSDDARLAEELLRNKVLTAGQIKAALDYQAMVGGSLGDVVVKLGLARPDQVERRGDKSAPGEQRAAAKPGDASESSSETRVDPTKLRVHRKLLDKAPPELAQKHGLLFFFPPPGTRAILMSAEPQLGGDAVRRLEGLLGVEIREIELSRGDRERLLAERNAPLRSRAGKDAAPPVSAAKSEAVDSRDKSSRCIGPDAQPALEQPRPPSGEAGAKPPSSSHDSGDVTRNANPVLAVDPSQAGEELGGKPIADLTRNVDPIILITALVELMVKKHIINTEELEVEIEILKRSDALKARARKRQSGSAVFSGSHGA